MTLPPDVQKVLDIAARLAGGIDRVELQHLFRAVRLSRPADLVAAAELYELVRDHLEAEIDIGLHPQ